MEQPGKPVQTCRTCSDLIQTDSDSKQSGQNRFELACLSSISAAVMEGGEGRIETSCRWFEDRAREPSVWCTPSQRIDPLGPTPPCRAMDSIRDPLSYYGCFVHLLHGGFLHPLPSSVFHVLF
jgi:hypothetical protein